MTTEIFRVYSSHGELICRLDNGNVVADCRYDANDPQSKFLNDVMRVDKREWEEFYEEKVEPDMWIDILCIGYWIDMGNGFAHYEDPIEEFRK